MHAVCRLILGLFLCAVSFQVHAAVKTADLPDGMVWFNTDKPSISLQNHNRFVLLHFGIYSTVNADLAIKDIKALAVKYPNELTVIGIHAAKFFEQGTLDDIRSTIQKQGINYPVAVDEHLAAWKAFHVYALPMIILISPDGDVLFRKPGEGVFKYIDRILTKRIGQFKTALSRASVEPSLQGSDSKMPSDQKNVVADGDLLNAPDREKLPIDVTRSADDQGFPLLDFDFDRYVGEKVRINREYSRHVDVINIHFVMPPKTHLLSTVKSYVRVFTQEGELLGGLETPDPDVEIPVGHEIKGDRLFIEAAFYYTREGSLGLYKGLLFEVPLTDYSKSENIDLNYNISYP